MIKSRAYEMFQKHMQDNTEEIAYDKNANASMFSFSNFSMDYAAAGLAEMTRDMMDDACVGIVSDEDKNFFWNHESHMRIDGAPKYFYFHDITKGVIPYCYATSTGKILYEGLQYVEDYPSSKPARFDSYIAQVIDLVLEMSQDHAGAIAVPDLFVNSAEFFKSPEEVNADAYHIANVFQSMIFTFHRKVRPSGQSPFVNVTIADAPTLTAVFKQTPEQIEIIKALQLIFLKEFAKGCNGKPFRFPVTTANLALDNNRDIIDMPWLVEIAEYLKTGRQNIYISKDPRKFASCCRMANDLDLLMDMAGVDSFGNGGVRIGSHRVITLNIPKIVTDGGLEKLSDFTGLICKMLKAHRELLRSLIDHKSGKFLKFFKHGWENLDTNFFSTVGVIGVWESAVIMLEKSGNSTPTLEEIVNKMKDIMAVIKTVVTNMAKELAMPINIEQIPGESAAADLATEINTPILSNQYIPLWEDVDILDRIRYAGELDAFFTGGAITHLNIEKGLSDNAVITMIKMAALAGMTHFAPTHIYSECTNRHSSIGKRQVCPICGEKVVDYITRIIGYFVPVSSWNKHRKQEFKKRIIEEEFVAK
ncbi:MAG: anaerobic ribonucleoside triphosphate reductase [Parcubacteria group bacterium ADurb.Bin192]|nr:MAG: anaerobic ribonucleoside triphosphate reductase [Parcubacteria group bacterium ADurb.Bin192]